jgi:hypothetical protein
MQLGYESKDAERVIREIGSFPETQAQLRFVRSKRGLKEASEEQQASLRERNPNGSMWRAIGTH